MSEVGDVTGGRLREARDQAQQGRLTRAGPTEEPDDLPFVQLEVHALENQQLGSLRLGERFADIGALKYW